MTDLPKMTEEQAYQFYELCQHRLAGWEVVGRTKHHPRSKAAQAAGEFWRRTISEAPDAWEFVIFAQEGRPVHVLWPEDMQDEVERQINTKVPRTINEPTSTEFIASMHECGRADWVLPDFLIKHGRQP